MPPRPRILPLTYKYIVDSQLAKILNNTASALKQIGLESRRKDDADAYLSDEAYLEAHPERRPVVVIDNFLHKAQDNALIYDKLAEWYPQFLFSPLDRRQPTLTPLPRAARITTANIAHVIFLTVAIDYSKTLSKALPDRVFRTITLGDFGPEVAKRYVLRAMESPADTPTPAAPATPPDSPTPPNPSPLEKYKTDPTALDACIAALGGRLTDLEYLGRRIRAGESPERAVDEIVAQAASEILKLHILSSGSERRWTPAQAWLLVERLAQQESLRYNELALADVYKASGDADAVLRALEQAELITIVARNGRPAAVRAGKPVFRAAFRLLTEDRVLKARLDLAILADQVKLESAGVDKCEGELKLLAKLPRQPRELEARTFWLLGKIQAAQVKIEQYEAESARLKKILSTEY